MRVGPDGHVSGNGTWQRKMVGSGRVSAVIVAKAPVTFSGSSTKVRYTGTARTVSTFSDGVQTRTTTWKPTTVRETLAIGRAGTCRISGSSTFRGVTLRWEAVLKGSGTCRT
jgi:hypothetical protein